MLVVVVLLGAVCGLTGIGVLGFGLLGGGSMSERVTLLSLGALLLWMAVAAPVTLVRQLRDDAPRRLAARQRAARLDRVRHDGAEVCVVVHAATGLTDPNEDGDRFADLDLEVRAAGRPPYRLVQRFSVPAAHLPAVMAGPTQLAARVDPADAELLLIDWGGAYGLRARAA